MAATTRCARCAAPAIRWAEDPATAVFPPATVAGGPRLHAGPVQPRGAKRSRLTPPTREPRSAKSCGRSSGPVLSWRMPGGPQRATPSQRSAGGSGVPRGFQVLHSQAGFRLGTVRASSVLRSLNGTSRAEGSGMGADCAASSRQASWPCADERPARPERDLLHPADSAALARPSRALRSTCDRFQPMGQGGRLASGFRGIGGRFAPVDAVDRQFHHPGSPACRRRKGAPEHAIDRSRGALTSKIHVVLDESGLPVRLVPAAGQASDKVRRPRCLNSRPHRCCRSRLSRAAPGRSGCPTGRASPDPHPAQPQGPATARPGSHLPPGSTGLRVLPIRGLPFRLPGRADGNRPPRELVPRLAFGLAAAGLSSRTPRPAISSAPAGR